MNDFDGKSGFGSRSGTVLLVEDSICSAEALRLLCGPLRIRLRRAESLATAERHLARYQPDAIILDNHLPDGEGGAWLAGWEERCPWRARPRVFGLSADPGGVAALRAAGAEIVMLKPLGSASDLARGLGLSRPGPLQAPPPDAGRLALAISDDLTALAQRIEREGSADMPYARGLLTSVSREAGLPALGPEAGPALAPAELRRLAGVARDQALACSVQATA